MDSVEKKRTLLIHFLCNAQAFIGAVAKYGGMTALHVDETKKFGMVTYKTEALAEHVIEKLKSHAIYSFKVINSDYQPDRSCLHKGRTAKQFEEHGTMGRYRGEHDASLSRSENNRMGARNDPHDDGSSGAGKNQEDGSMNEPFPENSVEKIQFPGHPDVSLPPLHERQGTPATDFFFTLPFVIGITSPFRVLSCCYGNVCWLGFPNELGVFTGIERGNAPLIQPSPNTIALGFSQSRRGWFRCYVERCDGDKFFVVFIDTGDVETITDLAELPKEYFTSPAMAFPCVLYQPSEELLDHFKMLAKKEESISLLVESIWLDSYVLRYSFKGKDVVLKALSWKSCLEGINFL